jgi:tetratricopeptide (TPR) repeat protein
MSKPTVRLLALLTAFVISATTNLNAASEAWLQLQSPHFTVVTDANEKQGRHIADQFERMRWVFQTLFPKLNVDPATPIVVIAVRDKKGFQELEPEAYLAKGQINLTGLFLHGPDKNYILVRLDGQEEHPFATVYHEYTHVQLSGAAEWLPLWLNEGLAEFFQNTDIRDKEVNLGQASVNDILYLRQHRLLPLATLFQVDASSPYYHEEQKGSVFYAESWALTHYLEMTDKQANTHRLGDYVELLSKHQDPVTAAAQAFGDLQQLQKNLDAYVANASIQTLTAGNGLTSQKNLDAYVAHARYQYFRMTASTTIDSSKFQLKALTLPQANAIRADLLAYNQRTKDARALLDTVLRDDPNNTLAHETMGYLSFREGDRDAALKWYEQAVKLDSQSYLAHFYYAAISMQNSGTGHDAEVEASLRQAINLNPAFAPSYDRLAVFYGMRHKQLDEAHTLSLRAVQLDPSNISYRMNAANVLVEEGLYQYAINVLTASIKVARTPEETAALQNRIKELENFAARREQAAKPNQQMAENVRIPATDMAIHNNAIASKPKHPAEQPHGPKLIATGVIRGVQCTYPAVIEFKVEAAGKNIDVYSDNYFKVAFTAANLTPKEVIRPCADLEGLKARVEYSAVSDKSVDGQIASVQLSK